MYSAPSSVPPQHCTIYLEGVWQLHSSAKHQLMVKPRARAFISQALLSPPCAAFSFSILLYPRVLQILLPCYFFNTLRQEVPWLWKCTLEDVGTVRKSEHNEMWVQYNPLYWWKHKYYMSLMGPSYSWCNIQHWQSLWLLNKLLWLPYTSIFASTGLLS